MTTTAELVRDLTEAHDRSRVYTVGQASRRAGIGKEYVRRLIKMGVLVSHLNPDRQHEIDGRSLDAYIESRNVRRGI